MSNELNNQDPCTKCGKTLREQMKGCDKIYCYRQFLNTTKPMSNEPKHTPTPWEIDDLAISSVNSPEDGGDLICEAPIGWEDSMKRWVANAARIVQCVNACEGLDDPEKWIKQQKEYRSEMANSSLSAEVDKRMVLQSQLESLRAANAELHTRLENEARDLGVAEHEINQLKASNAELVEALRVGRNELERAKLALIQSDYSEESSTIQSINNALITLAKHDRP